MTSFLRAISLLTLGCAISLASSAFAIEVNSVKITGNRRVDSAALRAQLTQTSGAMSDEKIASEVKALYKTGYLSQVSASFSDGVLTFAVVEKPVIRKVFIQGNKAVDESDLKEIFKFGTNRFLDRSKIFALIKQAISYYQAKGYYDANFEYSITPVADNQVDLVLTVTEGLRYEIQTIKFRGLKQIDQSDLLATIQTKRYKWWNSWLFGTGRLNIDMLENDKALVRQYFLDHGFVDATLSDPIVDAKNGEITIKFDVVEGRQYKIGLIEVSGDTLEGKTNADLLAKVKSKPGETFSAGTIREDSFLVSDNFTDVGYAFANVTPETRLNRDAATVDINFAVTKGKEVTVNRIAIKGNEKTYDHVIRRELTISEQELYSSAKVKRSQALLERTGFFEETSITNETTDKDNLINLLVNVREGSTGTFSAGAGFSSSDGVLFNAKLAENNLFGTGRSLSLNADLGTERDSLVATFSDRRINDTFWQGSINGMRSYRQFDDFNRVMTGGSVEFGYPLERVFGEDFQDIDYSVGYELYQIDIKDVNVTDGAQLVINSQGYSTASSITQKLIRNTIDNPLDPKSGSRQILSFEASGVGGDQEYCLGEARNQFYQPLLQTEGGTYVFSNRTILGYGESYNDEPFPLFKRYFPGGINSVRGYKNRSLGPKDSNGNVYGGSKELINNAEVIVPLVRSAGLKAVVFYDAGQAYDDDIGISIAKLRQAYGAGIRWGSPLGPIRVEFGFPIDKQEGDSSMVTMFAFGAPM